MLYSLHISLSNPRKPCESMAMTSLRSSCWLIVLSFTISCSALPLTERSELSDWIRSIILPEPGNTISDEIKCYGLPYGSIGNASHILTYWTIGCIFFYRAPWCPWKRLRSGKFDLWLGLVQVVVSAGVAGLTIARCRNRWQFILLAAARLQFSLTLGYTAVRTSIRVMYTIRNEYKRVDKPAYEKIQSVPWLVHLAGLPGLAALGSLVHELWNSCQCESNDSCQVCEEWSWKRPPPIHAVSAAFLSAILVMAIILAFCIGRRKHHRRNTQQTQSFNSHIIGGLLSLLLALYTDWVLAIIADNLTGAPSGDVAVLYWVSRPQPSFENPN